jgi:hypothetical protein
MIAVEFTTEEVRAALALCDIAVKAGGLQVAEAGLVIARKLDVALKAATESEPVEEVEGGRQ